jgi:hypothetical protein
MLSNHYALVCAAGTTFAALFAFLRKRGIKERHRFLPITQNGKYDGALRKDIE